MPEQSESLNVDASDIPEQTLNIALDKILVQSKSIDIFHISPQKLMLWVLFIQENICCQGASNEYPRHIFVEK